MVKRELSHPPSPVETLDGPELTAVDSGLHHHVVFAGPFLRGDDLVQILQIRGHWHCAGTVLPGIESRNRIVRMKRHGCEKDRKSTRLNSSHVATSYAVFCVDKKQHQT